MPRTSTLDFDGLSISQVSTAVQTIQGLLDSLNATLGGMSPDLQQQFWLGSNNARALSNGLRNIRDGVDSLNPK